MFPVHQNQALRGISYVCCTYPTTVVESCLPSVQVAALALFVCCGQALVPVLLRGQFETALGLQLGQARCLPSTCLLALWLHQLQDSLPVLFPERLLLAGSSCSQTGFCPQSV